MTYTISSLQLGDFVICPGNGEAIITFHADGRITIGDKAKPDEAAKKMLEVLAEIYPQWLCKPLNEVERLQVELDVYKRYINRDIQAQIDAAFETKKTTGKFPFED